jgi:hypothetical protein
LFVTSIPQTESICREDLFGSCTFCAQRNAA